MIRIFLLLAAAASAGSPAAAAPAAAPAGEPFRVAIPVGDLASPAGRAAFDARVDKLATRSCAPRPYPAVYEPESLRRCRSDFRAAAEAAAARRHRS